ncbi:uncharacterized protein PHACADRAFT_252812 [Phanerochaete carnosa HHB-10118-sp]|uniref:Uncharacterized protein n=1 Tax=Phanerochaete carnosa (strain HHB-10118-sp) TaxID=650164 RepID=K5WH86_PHACS|nr:uncharacterized protein PHACADRAFT_252812 [Phanerochaete carnosa HHB-10118-sp]EKM58469.1 hypothetical protein PHACADRAFT_252812 [Phanerochaete carnosa HHB-10118-sp]
MSIEESITSNLVGKSNDELFSLLALFQPHHFFPVLLLPSPAKPIHELSACSSSTASDGKL